MPVRGIRGATTTEADTAEAIRYATRELLAEMMAANGLDPADVASVIFTVTPDLTAEQPARAARDMGWTEAALLCVSEMVVPGGLPRCLRVLIHWNTDVHPEAIHHVYLHAAARLRPDRAVQTGQPHT
ncbi:MAG TPA: chorismate mutase [Anaerolineales bacterium]|nr:chorismate mutase [Anaerolineales bacterium]